MSQQIPTMGAIDQSLSSVTMRFAVNAGQLRGSRKYTAKSRTRSTHSQTVLIFKRMARHADA